MVLDLPNRIFYFYILIFFLSSSSQVTLRQISSKTRRIICSISTPNTSSLILRFQLKNLHPCLTSFSLIIIYSNTKKKSLKRRFQNINVVASQNQNFSEFFGIFNGDWVQCCTSHFDLSVWGNFDFLN